MKVTMTTKENEKGVTIDTKDLPKIEQASKELAKAVKESKKTETELQIEKDAIALSRRAFINKIKVDKKFHAMTINYSGSNKKGGKETTYTGYEERLDKKYDLIQSLIYPVMEILQFPEEWEDDIIVTGISFNYDVENDNSLRGMVVTMQKTVEGLNCPLNINTPFIRFSEWVDNYCSFPSEDACWDYDVSEKVKEIINNCYLYICGDTKNIQEKLCI